MEMLLTESKAVYHYSARGRAPYGTMSSVRKIKGAAPPGLHAERFWTAPEVAADLLFLDLPGVEIHDPHALGALREQLAALPQPHVHLVLNAACESNILFEQIHAFAPVSPEDVVFTHLDEERQRVKLWNFV